MPSTTGSAKMKVSIVYFDKNEEEFAEIVSSNIAGNCHDVKTVLLDLLPQSTPDLNKFQADVANTVKLVLIVNTSILQTSWLDYVCMHSKNSRLFPVLFNVTHIPADYSFLETLSFEQTYMKFASDDTEAKREPLWKKLETALSEQKEKKEQIESEKASVGLAWGYFYGYLKLILPGLKARVKNSSYHALHKEKKMLAKMFIVLPMSCRCPQQMKLADQNIVFDNKIDFSANRAGNENRNYAHVVQKITHPLSQEEYYCICEFATPVMSLYEMCDEKVARFTEKMKEIEMLSFRNYLMYILRHPKYAWFGDRAELIIWDDNQAEESLSELLCRRIKNGLEIENLIDDSG